MFPFTASFLGDQIRYNTRSLKSVEAGHESSSWHYYRVPGRASSREFDALRREWCRLVLRKKKGTRLCAPDHLWTAFWQLVQAGHDLDSLVRKILC
jgi:hypothetical protein